MIHLQLVPRDGANLKSLIRQAIANDKIRSFTVSQIQGGLRIKHKKHVGDIQFKQSKRPFLATLICKNRTKEWQLLEALIGRLAYHFPNEMAGINIQFEPRD